MLFKKSVMTAAVFAVGSFAVMSANAAGTQTDTFAVTMKVNSVCRVDTTGGAISFDEQDAGTLEANVGTAGVATSSGTIGVTCSLNAPYIVNLKSTNDTTASTTGAGQMNHADGVAGINGDNKVTYQLYSAVAAAEVNKWGSDRTLSATNTAVSGTGAGLSAEATTHQVFARLTSSTDVKLGNYSDTVTATVIY